MVAVVVRLKEKKEGEDDSRPPSAIDILKNPYHLESGK
jgi:hypothetical protein